MFTKLKIFIEESRQELKRVNWPTTRETARYTGFVIGFSLGLAIFLGFLDSVLLQVLQRII